MITLSEIQDLYNNMHAQGINTDQDMLYGYFFTDHNAEVLLGVAKVLEPYGFKFVDIHPDEDGLYWLHVERVEIHTPQTLHELNQRFYELAKKWKITSYDGFDIGNQDPTKPIDADTYIVQENFAIADRIVNNLPELIVVNCAFDDFKHKTEFKYFIYISCNYKCGNEAMLPTEPEIEALDKFEMFVEENLNQNRVDTYYIYRSTHNGERKFALAVKDNVNAKGVMEFIKEHTPRKYVYQIIEDAEWKFYDEVKALVKSKDN